MDLQGSLIDTNLKIYPSSKLIAFLESLEIEDDTPFNVLKLVKRERGHKELQKSNGSDDAKPKSFELTYEDIKNLHSIKESVQKEYCIEDSIELKDDGVIADGTKDSAHKKEGSYDSKDIKDKAKPQHDDYDKDTKNEIFGETKDSIEEGGIYLTTHDMDWLYTVIQRKRTTDKTSPFLHELLEGSNICLPENKVLKRNPDLEARCVKLRAQQEHREYRKMTKGVDNVRMKFPEDSISYQMKQLNRQLIAIGQFLISIFAGFLFGFRGVEWMVGNLDFGFRLLLGVMCALVIALAEIYFLAKKLNEELNVPETVQLGGPPKFVDEHGKPLSNGSIEKEHIE